MAYYVQKWEYQGPSSNSDSSSGDASDGSPVNRFCQLMVAGVARARSVSDAGIDILSNPGEARSESRLSAPICGRRSSCGEVAATLRARSGAADTEQDDDSDSERHPIGGGGARFLSHRSTGNFVGAGSGASGGGGGGAPRTPAAPATHNHLQPPATVTIKNDKNVVKHLSSSAPSVRVTAPGADGDGDGGDGGDGKAPSKARQKKFLRNFPQVGPDERVLNYYSCALVGDILLQGHLYITNNYFAFYSNVFGYVTKLLIPTASVLRVSKEKMARIIPNAVGVCTRDERHVFGSLLSRDSTYKLMLHVWKAAIAPEIQPVVEELHISEADLDASEYSMEDETSSGSAELHPRCTRRISPGGETSLVKAPAVIQPSLLLGAFASEARGVKRSDNSSVLLFLALCLAASAAVLAYRVYKQAPANSAQEFAALQDGDVYGSLVAWQARLHDQSTAEVHGFLDKNLLALAKVRQSLEALSAIMLEDVGKQTHESDTSSAESSTADNLPMTSRSERPQESGVS